MSNQKDETRLVTVLLVVIGVIVVFPMFFVGFGMMGSTMGGMWGHETMSGWMGIVGIVLPLLFLAGLVGGGYLVYRTVAGSESDADRALEELRVAYARGELTDDEYEHRREALERDTDRP